MKILNSIILIILLVVFTSCSVVTENKTEKSASEINNPVSEESSDVDTPERDIPISEESQQDSTEENNIISDEANDLESTEESTNDTENYTEDDVKTDSGKYNGLIDSNFFELKISGVPDSIPGKIFMLTDDIKEKFDKLKLNTDDEIKIKYYENEHGQLVIIDIEKLN